MLMINIKDMDEDIKLGFDELKNMIEKEDFDYLISSITYIKLENKNLTLIVAEEKIKGLIEGSLVGEIMEAFDLNGIRVSVIAN